MNEKASHKVVCYGRIKVGTRILHDRYFARWPDTAGGIVNANTRFAFTPGPHGSVIATAPGFGEHGNYGNGSIYLWSHLRQALA